MDPGEDIGAVFRRLRTARRISRSSAAKLVGCSTRTLDKLEAGGTVADGIRKGTVDAVRDLVTEWQAASATPSDEDAARAILIARSTMSNAMVVLEDPTVPAVRRLAFAREQMLFLLDYYLREANHGDEPGE